MTREEYEEKIDNKIKTLRTEQSAEVDIKLDRLKQELMAEFKEEPNLDEWKVGDKYFYSKFGKIIETTVCYNDNKDGICDFDMFMIKHGYAKHTSAEVEFQIERDAVLYELSKFAEPKDRVWGCSLNNHWYMYWNYREDRIGFDLKYICKYNDIYFASREDAEKAMQAVGEERVKRFYLEVEE